MPRKIATMPAISPHGHVQAGGLQAEPAGQQLQVEVAEGGVEEHLEDGVEGDQDGGHLPVAAGQVVPDQHHGDAAGQADQDDPGAVGGLVGQQQPGQREHQRGADDPVERQAGGHHPAVGGDVGGLVVADLGQHRVHHQQQPERDRQAGLPDLDGVEGVGEAGDDPAEQQPGEHRHADPHRQEPVQRGQPLQHVGPASSAGPAPGPSVPVAGVPVPAVCRSVMTPSARPR